MNLAISKKLINNNAKLLSNSHLPRIIEIGDSSSIRWNINKFEVVRNDNYAVKASVFGAQSFAEFYGYDLPTEIEWEKAARGPEFDDAGEHQRFQWGNDDNQSKMFSIVNTCRVKLYKREHI